ncbi:recombinase family protein, partial [Enterobacter hormaechei]|uniref:recombinase family protein n=1 Tax=Enterobacter hormaechei TaxID=158836 RepID=UPI003742F7CE
MSRVFAYCRVSTLEQTTENQRREIEAAGFAIRSQRLIEEGTVAKLAMRQPFVLFKGLTFQKLCLPGAFRPG